MWIEAYRHDALTPLFKALSFTGEPTFFLLVLTVGYWALSREIFTRATLVLVITGLVNSVMKAVFQAPRPDPSFALVVAEGWSFPSGHATVAAAIWPWLALDYQDATGRRWALPLAVVMAFGVAASRVYLGVHSLRDVCWGLLCGALILAIARFWMNSPPTFWSRLGETSRFLYLGMAVLLAVFSFPIHPHDTTGAKSGGVLLTLWLGAGYARRISPELPRGFGTIASAVAIGLVVTFALRWGLKELLTHVVSFQTLADFLRYRALGLWIALGAPWVFRRLGLVRRPA